MVYLNGQVVSLNPSDAIGKGGEADVYAIGGQAIKVFKPPNHPDYAGQSGAQEGARRRIAEHQQKLRHFPGTLPSRVVAPSALVTDKPGQRIEGYAMPLVKGAEPLLRYADAAYRQALGYPTVTQVFKDLHRTVSTLHRQNVVIGDFNDLNVLVKGQHAYLINADSFQFAPYLCTVYTARFLDVLLAAANATAVELTRPYRPESDWYAYAVLLMQSLLGVDPYGGLYRPKDSADRVPHPLRPLKRITVFHPEVRYPKPAAPYGALPDELLERFTQVFEHDLRDEFPADLLELDWRTCPTCKLVHARATCPVCTTAGPTTVPVTSVRGRVTARTVFTTDGRILATAVQGGALHVLYHERGEVRREDGSVVTRDRQQATARYRLMGKASVIGEGSRLAIYQPGQPPTYRQADTLDAETSFDATNRSLHWIRTGQLMRQGKFGDEYVGDVLEGQTRIWTGSPWGFGYYRAGALTGAFIFHRDRPGINDRVALPPVAGQQVDAEMISGPDRIWFFLTVREGGRTLNRCYLLKPDGELVATAETDAEDGTWLGTIHGHVAIGKFVLAATDEGVVRVEAASSRLAVTKTFPDTEPFVSGESILRAANDGLYVVDDRLIRHLIIK